MYKLINKAKYSDGPLKVIFVATLFFAFHVYFILYLNSTFLKNFVSAPTIGILYSIGAIMSIFLFLCMPEILRKIGNYKYILLLSILEIIALSILATQTSSIVVGIAFVFHQAINPLIMLSLDIGIEDVTDKKGLGKTRGIFLTMASIAAVCSPIMVGAIIRESGASLVYFVSLFFMFFFMMIVTFYLKNISNGTYRMIRPLNEMREFTQNKNIFRIGIINFILRFFYVWMVIYMPLYLKDQMGFAWSEIGIILSIALLPFILLEIPVGEISDKKSDEKDFMKIGLLVMGLSCIIIPFINQKSLLIWAGLLFVSRIGASLLEASSESYFFKKSKQKDELIGIYRMAGPIAFIVGPIIGSILIPLLPISLLFGFLGAVVLSGVIISSKLEPAVS